MICSTSISSGDSDLEDLEDQVDGRYEMSRNNVTGTAYRAIGTDHKSSPIRHSSQHHHRSSSSHASSTARAHSSKSHTAPIPGVSIEGHQQTNSPARNYNHATPPDNLYHRFMPNRSVSHT